jgi:hypothetical protein
LVPCMSPKPINLCALVDVTKTLWIYMLWCHGCHQTL